MTRIDVLRSQAHVLWRLAESFDIAELRHDLRAIAAACEEMADQLSREQDRPPEPPSKAEMRADGRPALGQSGRPFRQIRQPLEPLRQ